MAKGRMLNKSISLNHDVNALSCDTSRLLFTWIISHLDANGCFYGDPKLVKNIVFPHRDDLKVKKIEAFLNEFELKGLIKRYKVDDIPYIFYPAFDRNQPGLRKDREAKSNIPPYENNSNNTPELIQQDDGNTPPQYKYNRSIIEVEGNSGVYPPEWCQILLDFKHFDIRNGWCSDIEAEFGLILNLIEASKDFIDYWSERKKQIKSMKTTYKNSLKNCIKWGKCLNQSERPYTGR